LRAKAFSSAALGLMVWSAVASAYTAPWYCTLPDSVELAAGPVTLQDVAAGPVPAHAGQVPLFSAPEPGTVVTLERQTILRRLVEQGAAGGVKFLLSSSVVITFGGQVVSAADLSLGMKQALLPWLPVAEDGAPATWLELNYQGGDLGCRSNCQPVLQGGSLLRPGRQTVRFRVGNDTLPVGIVVHHFAMAARTAVRVAKGAPLRDGDLAWEWIDLATVHSGRLTGRREVGGFIISRTLDAGSELQEQDLNEPPVILAGDPVELRISRGGVEVSVRAYARRPGTRGQTIPVRNELTGKLINARVIGPGVVEWRY